MDKREAFGATSLEAVIGNLSSCPYWWSWYWKTTTTKVIAAFLENSLGPECMPESAPTNAAARLQGGDNCDALYKLLRDSLLSEKTGTLSDKVLKSFPREWQNAKAQNMDEVSMLPQNKLHRMDQRARSAKMLFEECFGGMVTNGCVDFYQLRPVGSPSIAMRLEDSEEVPVELLLADPTESANANARNTAKFEEVRFGCRL